VGHVGAVKPSWRPDALAVAYVDSRGRAAVYDLATGKPRTFDTQKCVGRARAVAYAPLGRRLAVAGVGGVAVIERWNRPQACFGLEQDLAINGLTWVGTRALATTDNGFTGIGRSAFRGYRLTANAQPDGTGGVVDVGGAVGRPGLYRLGQGTRIADAVSRAGGATPKADLSLINLAAPLADGEQVIVPKRGPAAVAAPAGGAAGSVAGAPSTGPVHLSTATLEQLDSLPGIGPVTAQKILDYRQKHGTFTSVDE